MNARAGMALPTTASSHSRLVLLTLHACALTVWKVGLPRLIPASDTINHKLQSGGGPPTFQTVNARLVLGLSFGVLVFQEESSTAIRLRVHKRSVRVRPR